MLTIDSLRREARSFPLLARVGLAGLLVAGLVDLIAHLEASGHGSHVHSFGATEVAAHSGVLVSMILVLLGVVIDGARLGRARLAARNARKGVA